jgi:hypothetical protein
MHPVGGSGSPILAWRHFFKELHSTISIRCSLYTVISFFIYIILLQKRGSRELFSRRASPYNISLFRIAVFGVLLTFDLEQVHWYASLPSSLQVAPPGLSAILPYLPTDSSTVSFMGILFRGACIFGLLELFTRTSATVALVTGLYVLGVSQLYGKVNHYHHLLWFTTLLVPSRSADVLSLDALWHSRRSSSATVPEPDRGHALPIRWVWLLIGVIYFFPGFWKFVTEGFGWALSENLNLRCTKKGF